MHRWFVLAVLVILVAFLGACRTADPAAPETSAVTAAALAEEGKAVYARSCAGCHGDQGQGANAPAVIGTGEGLAKYGNAQGLYDKIKETMPRGAPGSLSDEAYLQVVSFLLVEDSLVEADTPITADTLSSIEVQ